MQRRKNGVWTARVGAAAGVAGLPLMLAPLLMKNNKRSASAPKGSEVVHVPSIVLFRRGADRPLSGEEIVEAARAAADREVSEQAEARVDERDERALRMRVARGAKA